MKYSGVVMIVIIASLIISAIIVGFYFLWIHQTNSLERESSVNARIIKVVTWQGDNSPEENITYILPDGETGSWIYSCNYYSINQTISVTYAWADGQGWIPTNEGGFNLPPGC